MMMVERRMLQVLVELLVGMMSIGTPSKRVRSECWFFFFFFSFWCFMPKGEKIRGVINFFDTLERRLLQLESCSYPYRVVFVR